MQCGGGESIYFKSIHVKAQLNLDMADFNFDKNTKFYISQLFQHSYDIFVLEVHTFFIISLPLPCKNVRNSFHDSMSNWHIDSNCWRKHVVHFRATCYLVFTYFAIRRSMKNVSYLLLFFVITHKIFKRTCHTCSLFYHFISRYDIMWRRWTVSFNFKWDVWTYLTAPTFLPVNDGQNSYI